MSQKSLLVDAHTFDENHQGIRIFIKGIYSALDVNPSQLQVVLVANNIKKLKKEFEHQENFNFIALKSRNKYIRLAYEIPKLIKRHNFNYAHFNYYLPLFLNSSCQYIVTIHDVLFIDFPSFFPLKYRLINTFLFKRSAKKASIITTVSEYSAERIKKNLKIENKNITVLPNAISDLYKQEHNKQTDRVYIKRIYNVDKFLIYVSRIEPRKNHLKLVQAYQELQLWLKDFHLVLIGNESFKDPKLTDAIKEVNEASNGMLIRLNDISYEELIKFYNAADLAVFPSLCEGFGIPPIESAALKTPTICSYSTAMRDFVFFNDSFFDASSKEAIKNKIVEALEPQQQNNNQERLNEIAETVKNKYSWRKTANVLKNLIINDEN